MSENFNYKDQKELILKDIDNISLNKQNAYLNSEKINNNYLEIENELNSIYEKTRILENIIDYAKKYITSEIESFKEECREALKDIEILTDLNINEEKKFITINIPFKYNDELKFTDRDGTVLKCCDIYDGNIVMSQKIDIKIKYQYVSITRNENPCLFNDEAIQNNQIYMSKYKLDSIKKDGVNELIAVYFKNIEKINIIKIKLTNCKLKQLKYIYANNSFENEEDLTLGNTDAKEIIGIEFMINCTNYTTEEYITKDFEAPKYQDALK